ncbi:MAG: phosphate transport system substrate-binding protein [Lysobacterales bacterium]
MQVVHGKLVLALFLLGTCCSRIEANQTWPVYMAKDQISGAISVSGSPADRAMINAFQQAFQNHQPSVHFSNWLHGPESAIAGVYTDVADMAIMAREVREPMERMAFQWVKLERPFELIFANGGFNPQRPSSQLAVFVHQDNPLESISLPELDALFSAERKRGLSAIEKWGDVGLNDKWGKQTIHLLGPMISSIEMLFFRHKVMLNSMKWNSNYREFEHAGGALDALKNDPHGLAIAPFGLEHQGLKPLSLSADQDGLFVELNENTVLDGSYPLRRTVSIVIHHAPGQALKPELQEFLRFIYSMQGQQVLAKNADYLPLGFVDLQTQLKRIP